MPKTIEGDPLRNMLFKMFEKGKRSLTRPTSDQSPVEREARAAGYLSAGHEFMDFLTTERASILLKFLFPREWADPEDYIQWMLEDAFQRPVTVIRRDKPQLRQPEMMPPSQYITIVTRGQYARPKIHQDQSQETYRRLRLKLQS